ncbi:MAG TPA: hypothetical protein VNN80_01670, partial [Polyangiaceae bacterium]|nr:hypothetical protein [Polyangiaceae bacterium]
VTVAGWHTRPSMGPMQKWVTIAGWAVAALALVGCDVITGVGDYEVGAAPEGPTVPEMVETPGVGPAQSDDDARSDGAQAPGEGSRAAQGAGADSEPDEGSPTGLTPPGGTPPASGSGTPPTSGTPPADPTTADPVPPVDQSCVDQVFSFDDLYQTIARDLNSLSAAVALTTRYLTLTNRYAAGVCADTALEPDRQALFKLVNALSTESVIVQPVAIDADRTIFRIDLVDYGWDAPVTVVNADGSTTDFVDRWEAIVGNNPYAVPFVGDDADDAVADSGTTVPVMFADSMLDIASIGNLYYALIDVNVQDTLDNFILNDLQIDVNQNLIDEDQVRAGTTRSRISRQDRMVQRDEIEVRQGVLWQSFDFEDDNANQSIFEDPFGFAEGGTEAIFTLPNGLFGFVIADQNSAIVEDSDILLDTNQTNFRAVTMISCANCHAQGVIPVVDEVREIALANASASGLNADEVTQIQNIFPESEEFARVVDGDNAGFYQRALIDAGVSTTGGDPISSAFFRFDLPVELASAAGDLGVTRQDLMSNINILDPTLGGLATGGTLDRDDFSTVYVGALCVVLAPFDNTVDPALCDAVLANAVVANTVAANAPVR